MTLHRPAECIPEHVFCEPDRGGIFGGLFQRMRGKTSDVVQQPTIPRLNNHLLTLLAHEDLRFEALLQARRDVDPDVQEKHVKSTLGTLVTVKSVTLHPSTAIYSITDQGRNVLRKMPQK